MSRSTISTFRLFELFPDEESARKYTVVMYIMSMEATCMTKANFSLWGNGGGDDILIAESVSPLEAALQLAEDGAYQGKDGWSYFLVLPSRTKQCKDRGNVNPSDIASTQLPELSGSDELWVCEEGGIYEHKHCDECSLLSVSQILVNRL